MLSESVIEALCERLVNRIEEANTYALQKIGKSIKKIGTLSPIKAQELANVFKYGGNYEKITNKLAQITELNVKDIQQIFEQVAKKNQQFAKQFYDYKNIKYIPYEKNKALQNQVNALAKLTQNQYRNISGSLGYSTIDRNGKLVFTELSRVYQDTIDKAILSVVQGKSTFQEQMYSVIKELGSSGLKTVDYASGRSIRLDSVVRMNMQGALRDLSNELQNQFGEEYGADGVEISVHENPAPDHAEVQGRQFSKQEFEKFQNDQDAVDYQGKKFPAEFEGHDRRSISEYNCYHYIFNIVLGVNKPEYTSKQLQNIIDQNNTGFNYNGKHYTNYQGTQMQRKLETEIRKAKDTQILAKASGNDQLVLQSQQRITQLTHRYKEFSDAGNLPTKMQRMRVSGYRRTKVTVNYPQTSNANRLELTVEPPKTYSFDEISDKLMKKGVVVDQDLSKLDQDLVIRNLTQVDNLIEKYPKLKEYFKDKKLYIQVVGKDAETKTYASTSSDGGAISLRKSWFSNKENYIKNEKADIKLGWHNSVPDKNVDIYTITHEMGHVIENRYILNNTSNFMRRLKQDVDGIIMDNCIKKMSKISGYNKSQVKKIYFSGYAQSKRHFEWFAETFAQLELGEKNQFTDILKEWLEEKMK